MKSMFSIVSVVLNDRTGLASTRASLLDQEYRDFEWVVIDGGSSDGTQEIAHSAEPLKVVLSSEPDEGLYDAMNRGIETSSGRYVLFLNGGDRLVDSMALVRIAEQIEATPVDLRASTVYLGGSNLVTQAGIRITRPIRSPDYLWHGMPTSHQAIFYPRAYVEQARYDCSYRICGDYAFTAGAKVAGCRFVAVPVPVADFFLGGMSYRHPRVLLLEAARVQRMVLHAGLASVVASGALRIVNMLGLRTIVVMARLWRRGSHRARLARTTSARK